MALTGLDAQAPKLVDPSTDINVKLGIVRDIGRAFSLEAPRPDADFVRATSTVFPILIDTINTGSPVFKRLVNDKENAEQVLRVQTLEVLHKFTGSEVIRPHLASLVPLLFDIIRNDNEEMGALALKMFNELTRAARPAVDGYVPKFLNLALELYNLGKELVDELFSPTGPAMTEPDRTVFTKSFPSLKILQEATVLVAFIYQMAPAGLISQLPAVPDVMDVAAKFYTLEAPQESERDPDQMDEGTQHYGPPASIVHKNVFSDFITAQTKMGALIGLLILKNSQLIVSSSSWPHISATIPPAAIRIMRVMPLDAYATRREAMSCLRQFANTDMRSSLADLVPALTDEKMIIGNLKAEPGLISFSHTLLADVIANTRSHMNIASLFPVLRRAATLISDTTIPQAMVTIGAKIVIGSLEALNNKLRTPDPPITSDISSKVLIILAALLETVCSRLQASVGFGQRLMALKDGSAGDEVKQLVALEQSRTVPMLSYLSNENVDGALQEEKTFIRIGLIAVKASLQIIRMLGGRVPDATILGRVFSSTCHSAIFFRGDQHEHLFHKAMVDIFMETEPHVFQEVWSTNMEMFFDLMTTSPGILNIVEMLYRAPSTSYSLTALILRHLVDNLESLLENNSLAVAVVIRLLKQTFQSVANLSDGSERVIFPYLPRLLVDVFPMAARSQDPRNFLSVPFYLFRALGVRAQSARFEALHKEVYPLLPELLDGVNRSLELTDEPVQREQLVEIALTTPARLQHLAPYITHLWRPLVLALGSKSTELLKQGLRTLELTVENINNVDLLDPTNEPVARELVLALHKVLKPGQATAETAQQASRILGKIGGKNRRIMSFPPSLPYNPSTAPAVIPVEFTSHTAALQVGPACEVAGKVLEDAKASVHHEAAFNLLRAQILYLLQTGIDDRASDDLFVKVLEGLVSSIHLSNMEPAGNDLIREIAKALFEMELVKDNSAQTGRKLALSPVTNQFLDTVSLVLIQRHGGNHDNARRLIANIIQDLYNRGQGDNKERVRNTSHLLSAIVGKFVSLCWNPDWRHKVAGCAGFSVLVSDEVNLGAGWPYTKEIEFCRSLIMALKDMPPDPPAEVPEITATILKIMRFCNPPQLGDQMQTEGESLDENARKEMTTEEIQHYEWTNKPVVKKAELYLNIFSVDLTSSNKTVRDTIQAILGLIAELAGVSLSEFLKPAIPKLTTNIFLKPLRMFTPIVQIGFMDAMTYLLNIDPPVLEANDAFWRLMNEVIVLGELEDPYPAMPKMNRRATMLTAKTKAAAIRLITASLVIADYFSAQKTARQRATGLLFKALYASNPDIKEAAHDGLNVFLRNQSRLPRDHLQAGLRPVLMNLADAAKLTVDSLDGLARLLSLLTNYFKVEIATKLVDHFRALATDDVLREAAYGPMVDNTTISKLVRLLNIFHLLPPAANVYLEQVMTLVVTTETKIHAASPTLFTPPISAYLDRFPADGIAILFDHLKEIRWVQTFRHVIQAGKAPNFVTELKSRGSELAQAVERAENGHAGVPHILLCQDLAEADPEWMASQEEILGALKDVWVVTFTGAVDESGFTSARLILIRAIFKIWIEVLKIRPRVDLLFSLCLIFTRSVEINYSEVVEFVSVYMANNTPSSFKHEAVQYFVTTLDEDSDYQLLQYLRVVVIPLLTAEFRQAESLDDVVRDELMVKVWEKVWSPDATIEWSADFATEILQLTGVLVINAFSKIGTDIPRGAVAKYIWDLLKAPDSMVRNTAHLTAARFFSNKEVAHDKFQGSLWSALLKAPQDGETSAVSRQALDIMTPVMTRLPAAEMTLKWDAVICRTLSEEQNNISTTIHTYRLVLRHADQCYQSRDLFIPQFVHGLNKLGFNAGHTPETRGLALDLIDLIFEWQRRSSDEQKSAMAVDSTPPSSRWVMPTQLKDSIANFLIRLSLNSVDTFQKPTMNLRYLMQLKTLFSSEDWSEVSIRLSFFSRAFEMPENAETAVNNSLIGYSKVLNVISAGKPAAWFLANASELFVFSKRAMTAPQDIIVECFSPIFDRLLGVIPLGDESTELTGLASDVHQWLGETIRDALSTGTKMPATLSMLMSLAKSSPYRVEPFAGGLMKLYSKFIKDHLTPQPGTPTEQMALALQRIFTILDISRLSVAYFGDHRKQFLTGLVNLVTTSPSQEMRRRLLALTREWVLESHTTIPTAKEKASLIGKMQGWLRHGDTIYRDYLNLVYDVYVAPSLVRSDLTVRLETSFVLGCRVDDQELRTRFLDLFSNNIPKSVGSRLAFLLGGQSWESMGDFNWAFVVLDMMLGAINGEAILSPPKYALSTLNHTELRVQDIVQPMRGLLFSDPQAMHKTFIAAFPEVWQGLTRREQADITASIVHVLTKDMQYAMTQPNVFQTLLGAIQRCTPSLVIPPHVVKYLVKIYHAWYEGLEILQEAVEQGHEDDATIREANQDALAEIYAELCEDDYYYGLWRRRCLYEETNAGLSYEQNGFYHFAQPLYEAGQLRTRQNIYPMSETEYYVWEDHWMLCTEKLLQWDILQDVASGEGNADLALECAWRTLQTWNSENVIVATYMNQMQDPITPRRQLFKAYFTLNSMATAAREAMQVPQTNAQGMQVTPQIQLAIDPASEFSKIVDEANQLSLRKWATLPEHLTMAHVPILAQFQQVVELREASLLMTILLATTRENLNEKAHEAKSILHHWRERLPLPHDDIGIWNDLISWRQHVFHAVNKFYLPLLPEQPSQSTASTHAHRGHHESAWIINRFAHVARKHGLLQVCQSSLSDIYKLPNIEISEAFLKLREQARCHFEKPNEIYQGLEVINNTNLMYFTAPQKAEFFAMKGLFLHQLGRNDDANAAFAQAVQLDFSMPKAWHLWGVYSDDMHTANPTDFSLAANAVSCYLQAASLYKSAKCRPLLNRVLWLLSMDDDPQTVGQMWDTYKGEHVYWYWITLVPQLLTSLSQREGRYAHQVLFNIAKNYPQALYYHLRSIRDEFHMLRREHNQRIQATAQPEVITASVTSSTEAGALQPGSTEGAQPQATGTVDVVMAAPVVEPPKQPWDMAEELINLLKTGHPLLALTLEQLAEQIRERLKPANEEEIYRVTGGLLSEALHMCSAPARDINTVSAQLHLNAQKLAATLPAGKIKEEFDAQLLKRVPTMLEFIQFIIYLRDQYETILDRKPRITAMDVNSHYLAEFHLIKFEKIHVLGQFQEHKDPTNHFVEIKRVATRLERCRTPLLAFKRFSFIGHDGSIHPFIVQFHPPTRNVRRDERFMQLTRIFNETLQQKKEARKRNLEFHLLTSVSLNPNLRLLKIDASYVSLIDIHDEYCKERGFGREEPLLLFQEKLRTYYHAKNEAVKDPSGEVPKTEFWQLRLDAKNEIEAKYIPNTVLSNYMKRTMKDSWALWMMRKQFTLQMATNSWLIWCMYLHTRPSRYFVSRETGLMGLCEASIAIYPNRPSLMSNDQTPFRLTPNIQDFITPIGIEGLMTSSMLALSRGLLEPQPDDVEKQMHLFIRDDFMAWFKAQGRNPSTDNLLEFRMSVAQAIEKIIQRMASMTGETERKKAMAAEGTSQIPTTTVIVGVQQLINASTNPANLSKNYDLAYPWY